MLQVQTVTCHCPPVFNKVTQPYAKCMRLFFWRLGQTFAQWRSTVCRPRTLRRDEHSIGRCVPEKLPGNQIPILARVIAIADAYDAMTADRPYHRGVGQAGALEEIKRRQRFLYTISSMPGATPSVQSV